MAEKNKRSVLLFFRQTKNRFKTGKFGLNQKQKSLKVRERFAEEEYAHKKNRNLRRLLIIVAFFSVNIFLILYFISPFSDVGEISVEGTEEVIVQEVIESSHLQGGESLWRSYFGKKAAEERIKEKIPQIKQASISLQGMNDLLINISEYQTAAYLEQDNFFLKILENGTILVRKEQVARGGYPVLIKFEEGETLRRFLKEYETLDPVLQRSISEIEYTPSNLDKFRIRFYMNDGNEVVASIPTFADRLPYYPEMKEKADGISGEFNLEAGAFFTPFDSSSQEEEEDLE